MYLHFRDHCKYSLKEKYKGANNYGILATEQDNMIR